MSLIERSDQGQGHPGRFARSRGSLKQQRLPGQNLAAEVRQEHVNRIVIQALLLRDVSAGFLQVDDQRT